MVNSDVANIYCVCFIKTTFSDYKIELNTIIFRESWRLLLTVLLPAPGAFGERTTEAQWSNTTVLLTQEAHIVKIMFPYLISSFGYTKTAIIRV